MRVRYNELLYPGIQVLHVYTQCVLTVQQEQLILVRVQLSRYRYTFLLGDTGTRINNYLIILNIKIIIYRSTVQVYLDNLD